jgi:hypothetical protein
MADTEEKQVEASSEAIGAPPAVTEPSEDMSAFEATTYLFHFTAATGSSTTARAVPTRAASVTTRAQTSTRSGPWPPS